MLVDKEKEKKKWTKLVKSAQTNTKSFLGLDANYSTTQTPHQHSVEASKSLNNWNERVFKVMNNNRIFGGELKERRLDQYIEQLDETYVDNANPFLIYKMTGGSQINLAPKITVANMAMDGIRKLTKVCSWFKVFQDLIPKAYYKFMHKLDYFNIYLI